MSNVVLKVLNAEQSESGRVYLLLTMGFCMGFFLASYDVGATVLFLDHWDEQTELPVAIVISSIIAIISSSAFSFLQNRIKFELVSFIFLLLMSLTTIAMWYVLDKVDYDQNLEDWATGMAFVLLTPFNVVSLLIFWGIFNRIFNIRQSKRIIGGIDTGQLIAAIIALFTIPVLIDNIGHHRNLLLISSGSVAGYLVFSLVLASIYKFGVTNKNDIDYVEQKPYSFSRMISNKYIVLMGSFVILSVVALTFVDYAFINVVTEFYPQDGVPEDIKLANSVKLTKFLAFFGGAIVVVSFIFQTFFTDKIIDNYGLKVSLLITPVLLGIFTILAFVIGSIFGFSADIDELTGIASTDNLIAFMVCVALANLLATSLKDALDGPTFKLYFMPIDASVRLDAQTKIEGTILAFAGLVGGSLIIGINKLDTVFEQFHSEIILFIILFIIPVVGYWLYTTTKMHLKYRDTLKDTLSGTKERNLDDVEGNQPYAEIKKELDSDDPSKVIYALEILDKIDQKSFEEALKNLSNSPVTEISNYCSYKINAINTIEENEESLSTAEDRHNEIRSLAIKALEAIEKNETIPISPDKFYQLCKSKYKKDRVFVAKALTKFIDDENIFVLLELLRDKDHDVRIAAINTAKKTNRREAWPILIEMLASPKYSQPAISALIVAGDEALHTLDLAFHKSGQHEEVMRMIIKIFGHIGGDKVIDLLFSKLDYPNEKIINEILNALTYLNYIADESKALIINNLLDLELGKALWNMAAVNEIPEQEHSIHLKEALEEEIQSNLNRIFVLLSFIYERQSIQLVRENIENKTSEGITFALELLDIFIAPELKPKLFPVLDDLNINEKIKKLQEYFPRNVFETKEVLQHLIIRDSTSINRWTKTCAIYELALFQKEEKPNNALIGHLFNPDKLLRRMAAWAVSGLDRHMFRVISNRLPENIHKEFELMLENASPFDEEVKHMPEQLKNIIALKKLDAFKGIPGLVISEMVDHMSIKSYKASDYIVTSSKLRTPLIYFVMAGEVALKDKEGHLTKVIQGSMFGNTPIFNVGTELQEAISTEDSLIFSIEMEIFYDFISKYTELADALTLNLEKINHIEHQNT